MLGDTLYVSGHLGLQRTTSKLAPDPIAEAISVMTNVQRTLTAAGMTMDDLVSVQVSCTDLSLYADFNKVYISFFHKPYPTRQFIGVKELLFGSHFEVMGIAVRNAANNKREPIAPAPPTAH